MARALGAKRGSKGNEGTRLFLVAILGIVLLFTGCSWSEATTTSTSADPNATGPTSDLESTLATPSVRDFDSLTRSEQRLLRNLQWRMYWVIDAYNSFEEEAIQRVISGEWTTADEQQARRVLCLLEITLAEYEDAIEDFKSLETLYERWMAYLRTRGAATRSLVDAMGVGDKSMAVSAIAAELGSFELLSDFYDELDGYRVPKVNVALVTPPLTDAEEHYLYQWMAAFAAIEGDMGACQLIAEGKQPWSDTTISEALIRLDTVTATWSAHESPSAGFDYLHDLLWGALTYGNLAAERLADSEALSKNELVDEAVAMFRLAGVHSDLAFYLFEQIDAVRD